MKFPFWRSHHSQLLLEKEKRGRKETCIRTCRKIQEVLGFSLTHSTIPLTLLPYCKLQDTQPLSPNLLCHPQRPALNFHLVKQCKKIPLPWRRWNPLSWRSVGCWEDAQRVKRGKSWTVEFDQHLHFEKVKNTADVRETVRPSLGQYSNGSSKAGRKLFSEVGKCLLFSQGTGQFATS